MAYSNDYCTRRYTVDQIIEFLKNGAEIKHGSVPTGDYDDWGKPGWMVKRHSASDIILENEDLEKVIKRLISEIQKEEEQRCKVKPSKLKEKK